MAAGRDAVQIAGEVKGQRLALAEVASLVKLSGGADVSLDRVKLTVKSLDVKALREVRLDEVRR